MKVSILNTFLFLLFATVSFGQNYCDTTADTIPDCIFVCSTLAGNTGGFSIDPDRFTTNCAGSDNSKWIAIIADQNTFTMTLDNANCPINWKMNVSVTHRNTGAFVSDCVSFKSVNQGKSLTASNLIIGDEYLVKLQVETSFTCNFAFTLEGNLQTATTGTPDIQIEPFSTQKFGTLSIPDVPGAIQYNWWDSNYNIKVFKEQPGNRVQYINYGGGGGEICVTPIFFCEAGERKCIILPEIGCSVGADQLPGCLVECPNLNLVTSELSEDAFLGVTLGCTSKFPQSAYWFSLIAENSEIIIEKNSIRPIYVNLQIFDKNLNPVSGCKDFRGNFKTQLSADNLIPGETYSVCIGSNSKIFSGKQLSLNIFGNAAFVKPLPTIQFTTNSTLNSGTAFIDPSYNGGSYFWQSDKTIDFTSAQGTNRIDYENGRFGASIQLTSATSECGLINIESAALPGAFPPGFGAGNQGCLPSPDGILPGDYPPGCILCESIYQGSTEGYTATLHSQLFPCGTIENNQFISLIAGNDGVLSASVFGSNCQKGLGVEYGIYDQQLNFVSNCYSPGGTTLPGLPITATGLNPGEIYWLMIDGKDGDICDILVSVGGAVAIDPPAPTGAIIATPDTIVCPGATICYSIDPVQGATHYEWEIPDDANILSGGLDELFICLEFNDSGSKRISVTPRNTCSLGNRVFEVTYVIPLPNTYLPFEEICINDFPVTRSGFTFDYPGFHDRVFTSKLGCDSLVRFIFVPIANPIVQIDTTICFGSCIQIGSDCFDETGNYRVRVPNPVVNSCDSTIILNLTVDPNTSISSDFTADANVCINSPLNVNFVSSASSSATFDWNFNGATILSGSGSGPYQIAFADGGAYELTLTVTENGCSSARSSQTVVVNNRLADPVVNCQTSLSSVNFFWNDVTDASDYQVTVLTGQTGTLNGTEFEVSGLSPNEEVQIEVTAISSLGCANSMATQTCQAQDCSPLNLSINPISDICLNQNAMPIQMEINLPNLSGMFVWSGPGVSPTGLFDPRAAAVGSNQISVVYSENGCGYTAQNHVNVIAPPTASFASANTVCVGDNLSVAYTGNASPSANYNWNFGGGNIVTNSGSTNYEINFPSGGNFDISLSVEENGCTSNPISQTILVENQLDPPVIACNPTITSIEFAWNDVAGADSYNVSVISGQTGTLNGRTFSIQNLNPGDQVEIEVTANSATSCPNVSARATCVSQNCPGVDLDIMTIGDFCEGTDQITLSANAIGGVGGGTMTWSGPGVQGNMLDITGLASGNYTINLEYMEGACSYTASQNFSISKHPSLSSEVLSPIWYPGTIGSIDLTVSGSTMPYTYNWSNGATTEDLIDVTRGRLYCVTVTNSAGCEEQKCHEIGEGIYRLNPIHVVCRNEPKRLSIRPSRGANFNWSPATDLSCSDCASPTITTSQSIFYDVSATFANGRTDTIQIFILALPPGFCNTRRINEIVDDKWKNSDFDFQNSDETDLIKIEKEITESLIQNAVSIAPNPSSGIVNIESIFEIENAEVFDFSGRKVFSKKDVFEKENQSEIDLSNLAKGVYFIKIKTGGKVIVKRVILI